MISKNIEVELKVLVTKEQFYSLLDCLVPEFNNNFIEQINYYYTAVGMEQRDVLRIRKRLSSYLFTFKRNTDLGLEESEKELISCELDDEAVTYLKTIGISEPFSLLGYLTTNRYSIIIDDVGELSFDINEYNGFIDYEIEYECLEVHDYEATFKSILSKANIPYIPNTSSKYARFLNTKK